MLYEGRLHGPFDVADVDVQSLGLLMTGGDWAPGDGHATARPQPGSPPVPATQAPGQP